MRALIRNINLPDAPAPTKPAYKKPAIYYDSKKMRVVELPCAYCPKPAPIPKAEKKGRNMSRPSTRRKSDKRGEWTEERLKKLIDLYNAGVPYEDIAQKLGCSVTVAYAGIGKMRKAGRIPEIRADKGWTPEQDAELVRLYNEGVIFVEIGARIGRSKSAVGMRVFRLKERGILNDRKRGKRKDAKMPGDGILPAVDHHGMQS